MGQGTRFVTKGTVQQASKAFQAPLAQTQNSAAGFIYAHLRDSKEGVSPLPPLPCLF